MSTHIEMLAAELVDECRRLAADDPLRVDLADVRPFLLRAAETTALRDTFAAAAMQGGAFVDEITDARIAERAYALADAPPEPVVVVLAQEPKDGS